MGLFNARIKELENQLSALTTERDGLQATNAELVQANEQCATRHEADQTAIETLTAERDTARTELATATQERDQALANFDTRVDAEVTTRLAAAGAPPVSRDPVAIDSADGTNTDAPAKGRTATTWARDFSKKS